jgi:hypothetical protein
MTRREQFSAVDDFASKALNLRGDTIRRVLWNRYLTQK